MTVCTNDVTGVDLVEHSTPIALAKTSGDVEVLVPEVIELEHERVGLAAVDAGPRAEELDEISGALGDESLFPAHRIRDINARGSPHSAPVCRPLDRRDSSCPAAHAPDDARRSPRAV
jgi:hypothetical protein